MSLNDFLSIAEVGLGFGFTICTVVMILASILGLLVSLIKRI